MDKLLKVKGKNDHYTYKYNDKYIYSNYDPVKEAAKYINSLPSLQKTVITCCGADYINEVLIEKNAELIISFEPLQFDNTLQSGKIFRVKNIDKIESILLEKNIHSKDVSLIIWQPLIEAFPEIYLNQLKKLKDILFKTSISANTAGYFGFKETINSIINILNIRDYKFLFKQKNKLNTPAAVISSGASLQFQINELYKIQDKVYTIALPSSLPYLLQNNIFPDAAVAADPGYATYYHLAKYTNDLNLFAPVTLIPSIFNLKNINPLFFNYGSYIESIFFDNDMVVRSLPEGSVVLNILRILPQLGFKDAILFGQDFGYLNHRSHINEGNFEREYLYSSDYYNSLEKSILKNDYRQEKSEIKIKNKVIPTNTSFKIYYEHFLKSSFYINIMLTENCYNPISDKIRKINIDYILDNFNIKNNFKELLDEHFTGNISIDKKNVKEELIKILNIDKLSDELLNKLFIDKNNKKQKEKIKKIKRVLS